MAISQIRATDSIQRKRLLVRNGMNGHPSMSNDWPIADFAQLFSFTTGASIHHMGTSIGDDENLSFLPATHSSITDIT